MSGMKHSSLSKKCRRGFFLLLRRTSEAILGLFAGIALASGHLLAFGADKSNGTGVDSTGVGADDESLRWHLSKRLVLHESYNDGT